MKRRIIATVLMVLGIALVGSPAFADDGSDMTYNSICEKADCMTYN